MATGDIGAVIDTLEIETVNCMYPRTIRVSATICAIAHNGAGNDGWIKTAKVNADGSIDDAVIDSMEFETDFCWNMCIYHVSGAVYAIAYRGPTNHGWVKTVQINADGTIENAALDSLEFDVVNCDYPDLSKVGDGFYAVVFEGATGHCWVKTFTITDAGLIGAAVIDSLEMTAVISSYNRIRQIGTTNKYVVSQNRTAAVYAQTVEIGITGLIGAAAIDEQVIEAAGASFPMPVGVTNNVFAVAYTGPSDDGWIKTFTANDDGSIDDAVIDSMEFDAADCQVPVIILVGENVFVVAYAGTTTNGIVATVQINNDGTIENAVIDSLIFAAADSYTPDITHMDGDIYVVAFRPFSLHGYIKSIDIETPAPSGSQHIMMMGIG